MLHQPFVGIIGTGSTGCHAVKWCLKYNLQCVAFERNSDVGGVWFQQNEFPCHSPAYDSLFTNSSAKMMNISDFPFPFETKAEFPKHSEILKYYQQYVKHFKLNEHILFNSTVVNISKEYGKGDLIKWKVEYLDNISNTKQTKYFTHIIMCTGQLWSPSVPRWASSEMLRTQHLPIHLQNECVHAKAYRNTSNYKDKTVMVVGIGNTALDIALELADDPDVKQVYLSYRRGTTIIPIATSRGSPIDQILCSRYFELEGAKIFKRLYFYNLIKQVNETFQKHGLPSPPGGLASSESPFTNLKQSQEFMIALKEGRIKIIGDCVMDKENRHVLGNVDKIICATGYRTNIDILEPKCRESVLLSLTFDNSNGDKRQVEWLKLYQGIVPPEDNSIFFSGFVTTHGNESIVTEMQTRWICAVISKHIHLPPIETQLQKTNAKLEQIRKLMAPVPRFVRYIPYMDALAKDLGCVPPLPKSTLDALLHPSNWNLWRKLYWEPVVGAQYRITGRHALDSKDSMNLLSKL